MKAPKITLNSELPFIEMTEGKSGNVVFSFPPPKVTFNVTDDYSAYDYCTASGFANFPLMYREGKTGYPVFHNSFWNEDIELTNTTATGVTYEALTGYDASKSDAENLPYVAVHCQNRSQMYIAGFPSSPTNDNVLKVTNYDDFEVSFDYKFDDFGTDSGTDYRYSFLYHQGLSAYSYLKSVMYIAETDNGSVIFCGESPSYVDIDPATGETTNTYVYVSAVLNIDWTQWHKIRFVTAFRNDITDFKKSVVYLYVDNALIELHALNVNYDRTDGGINTNYALSVYFNCLSTRNAFYTGDYWIKNYQIKNRKPEYSGCRWRIAEGSGYVYSDENTFDLYRTADGAPYAFINDCEYVNIYNKAMYAFYARRIKTEKYDLDLQVSYDDVTQVMAFNTTEPYFNRDIVMQNATLDITDLSTSGLLSQQFICYPLSEDLTNYSQGWTSHPYSSLNVAIDNPVFIDGWCVLSADQNVNLGFQQYRPQSQQYSIEFYLRLTEANISGMNDIARIMYLFKTNYGTGNYKGSVKTYYLGFKAENNVAHNVLGYFVVYYTDSSNNVTIMSKFPYFKGTEIYHIACVYPMTYTAGRVIYINGSPVFNFPKLISSHAVQVIPDVTNQGAFFNNGGAVGFNCAIRGFRVCKMFVYTPYLNTDNVFFTCVDTINYSDTFNDNELQTDEYWQRVTAVMNNKQFDPFTLYPDFAYPETVSLGLPEIRWNNETTGQYLGISPITTNVTRDSVIKGIPHYPDFMGVNSVIIPEDVYMQFNIERQIPPTAVITTDSLVVYKGTYVTLSGADSFDNVTGYLWSNGSTSSEIVLLIDHTQNISLTVTNAYGSDTATVTIICKDTPIIDKSPDLVTVTTDALEVPISAIPYQEFYIILNNQNCYITLRQLGDYLYASLRVDNNVIFSNVICNINAPLNVYPSPYFTGILQFYDEKGTDKPHYSELGSRWKLKYRASRLPGEVY